MTELLKLTCASLAEPYLHLDHEDPLGDGHALLRLGVVDSGGDVEVVASLCLDPAGARQLADRLRAWADRQDGPAEPWIDRGTCDSCGREGTYDAEHGLATGRPVLNWVSGGWRWCGPCIASVLEADE